MLETFINWLKAASLSVLPIFGAQTQAPSYPGYIEGDYIYLSPKQGGIVEEIYTEDGQSVKAGAVLASMDRRLQEQELKAAMARREIAKARLDDSRKGLRPEEIKEIEARLRMAKADLELAKINFQRTEELVAMNAVPISRYDRDKALLNIAREKLHREEAALAIAKLPKREDQIKAAEEELKAAEAVMKTARINLDDRSITAPKDGRIEKVYVRKGENITAGTPILSLLPPDNIKVHFFIPEERRSAIHLGQTIRITCDGCKTPLRAIIKYISTEAEHTPPVIFSLDERTKLVFAVDAYLTEKWQLLPGQPVDVWLEPQ